MFYGKLAEALLGFTIYDREKLVSEAGAVQVQTLSDMAAIAVLWGKRVIKMPSKPWVVWTNESLAVVRTENWAIGEEPYLDGQGNLTVRLKLIHFPVEVLAGGPLDSEFRKKLVSNLPKAEFASVRSTKVFYEMEVDAIIQEYSAVIYYFSGEEPDEEWFRKNGYTVVEE